MVPDVLSAVEEQPTTSTATTDKTWKLSNLSFLTNGVKGSLVCDTGASYTFVNSHFVNKAGLKVTPLAEGPRNARVANGTTVPITGTVDVPMSVQLLLNMEDGSQVYWKRRFTLKDCTVADLGAGSPRSLYVAWRDWAFEMSKTSTTPPPIQPLANLAYMVFQGATVLDTPRVPEKDVQPMRVVLEQGTPSEETPVIIAFSEEGEDEAATASNILRQQLLERIPDHLVDTKLANDFVKGMLLRRKVFTPVDPKETTLTVDFVLIGEPQTVAFRVPNNRRVPSEAMEAKFGDWFAREIAEKVPWSTPSYGYAHIVPQPGGKFRVVINPVGLNKAIQSVDTPYLPKNMIRAAQEAGRARVGASLDLSEAFTTLKLTSTAKKYSTFVTQLGKIRFNNAYFGVKTFPAHFQTALYENLSSLPWMRY